MSLAQSWVSHLQRKMETIVFPVVLQSNTTAASVRVYAPNINGIYLFAKTDGQTITTYDAAPGFTAANLNDTPAPAILGCIIQVGDASQITAGGAQVGVELVNGSLIAGATGATALGAVTLAGNASTGVTLSGNLAFYFALTGATTTGAISTATFLMRVAYRKTQPL